jgi:hypothetical protein
MTSEPTVLDFVKALLTPWRGAPPRIPPAESTTDSAEIPEAIFPVAQSNREDVAQTAISPSTTQEDLLVSRFPWGVSIAVLMALVAQLSLEPEPDRRWGLGLALYLVAAAWVVWSVFRGEWQLPVSPEAMPREDRLTIRQRYLWIGMILTILAFLAFGGNRLNDLDANRFTELNVLLWLSALLSLSLAFWMPGVHEKHWFSFIWDNLRKRTWRIRISRWVLFLIVVVSLIVFFRLFRLAVVPPEMVGDHAEKLLDIWDVLQGQTSIFFPRNTGREGFQMYLTAAVIKIFGTGISFTSMKIATALAGLATLPFIYLLGKEIGSKRAGLLAMIFAGIAYWPNVITRVALRFTFCPLFVAPTLYFLIRGLRRQNRNDFILAGIFLGLGLHGYTPFRIVPFIVLVGVALYLLHPVSRGTRQRTVFYLVLLILIAGIVFLPLLRFWVENPELFSYRAFTRLGDLEQPLPGPAGQIFFQNLLRAMLMFGWNNGDIWPVSIPNRPALDIVSAALFYLGLVAIALRYLRRRDWTDLFLILSVPLLMLPSILSLAFPSENPALNRTAGAIIPVFVIIGICLDGVLISFQERLKAPGGTRLAWAAGIFLLVWSASQNYALVFTEYQQNYTLSSWNTTEIGGVIRDFSEMVGTSQTAYVVAYPYWVDTRLVGVNAGFPTRDFALWPENFSSTLEAAGPKLFVINPEDESSITELQNLYPGGFLKLFDSPREGKDFYMYFALPGTGTDG